MASTQAEALARYARARRVTDVTDIPFDPAGIDGEARDIPLRDALGAGGAGLRRLARRLPRCVLLLAAGIAQTPALPVLLG